LTSNQIQPGDAVFAHTKNFYGLMIRVAQALRWWKYREWNHMAIVDSVDEDGTVWVLQMARRCERVKLEEVAPGGHLKWVACPENLDKSRIMEYAREQIGTKYGILTIVSIAINLLLPEAISFDIHKENTLICSGFVMRSWEHGGFDCPVNPFSITPAECDELLGGGGTPIFTKDSQ
jgi:hypothetical protein